MKNYYEPGVHMVSVALGILNIIIAFLWLEETKNCSLEKAGTAGAKTPAATQQSSEAKSDPAEMQLLSKSAQDDGNPYKDTVVSGTGTNPTNPN